MASITNSSAPPSAPPSAPDTDIPAQGLSIAEAARRSGISAYTLRYYERSGLMPAPPGRTTGGSRRYQAAELEWIRVCTRMRAAGMPTELIRRYVGLLRAGPGNEQQRLELLEFHRGQIEQQLATLSTNLDMINHKIDVYRQHLTAGDADTLWSTPRDS